MNKDSIISVWGIRISMFMLWFSLIIGFLMLPRLSVFFSSKKSISILAWPTLLDATKLVEFEKSTGIKVFVSYFENNQELYTKIKETKGIGYDLIMPSDYIIEAMIQSGLLKKIDTTRLSFFDKLYPHLVGNYFDKNNEYSVPFFWSIYGIAYNKNHSVKPITSWKQIFNQSPVHTSMIDDAREAVLIAAQYLFSNQEKIDKRQLDAVKELLTKQNAWIDVYTEDRANYLLASGQVSVAVILQAVVARIIRYFQNISFIIPEEGSFLVIDSFVMPATTTKDDLVYQFLNYMYQPEVLSYYNQKFGYFSPIAIPMQGSIELPTSEQLKKADFFRNNINISTISDIWIAVKS